MTPTILCIDDDAIVSEVIQECLQATGLHVITAATVLEALDIVRTQPLDLILLDLMLPDVDGYGFFDILSAGDRKKKRIPIIVVSGCITSEAEELAREYGAKEFLRKPFLPYELINSVNRVLGTSQGLGSRKKAPA